MSIQCMTLILGRKLGSSTRKLIALKLGDHASDDGSGIYPALKRIAAETEVSERQVRRILREFEADGILIVVKEGGNGPKDTTEYRLDIEAIERLPVSYKKADTMSALETKRRTLSPDKGDTVSPKPSIEPSIDSDLTTDDESILNSITQKLADCGDHPSIIKPWIDEQLQHGHKLSEINRALNTAITRKARKLRAYAKQVLETPFEPPITQQSSGSCDPGLVLVALDSDFWQLVREVLPKNVVRIAEGHGHRSYTTTLDRLERELGGEVLIRDGYAVGLKTIERSAA